jgi:hypothetical protein
VRHGNSSDDEDVAHVHQLLFDRGDEDVAEGDEDEVVTATEGELYAIAKDYASVSAAVPEPAAAAAAAASPASGSLSAALARDARGERQDFRFEECPPPPAAAPEFVGEDVKVEDEGIACVLCLTQLRVVLAAPCGHTLYCLECARGETPRDCPICRASVEKYIRCYR